MPKLDCKALLDFDDWTDLVAEDVLEDLTALLEAEDWTLEEELRLD